MSDFWYEWSLVLREKMVLCNVERQKKAKKNEKFLPVAFPSEIFLNKSVL